MCSSSRRKARYAGRDYNKGVLRVYAILAPPGDLCTYPQPSTTRKLDVWTRSRGRECTNERGWSLAEVLHSWRRAIRRSDSHAHAREAAFPDLARTLDGPTIAPYDPGRPAERKRRLNDAAIRRRARSQPGATGPVSLRSARPREGLRASAGRGQEGPLHQQRGLSYRSARPVCLRGRGAAVDPRRQRRRAAAVPTPLRGARPHARGRPPGGVGRAARPAGAPRRGPGARGEWASGIPQRERTAQPRSSRFAGERRAVALVRGGPAAPGRPGRLARGGRRGPGAGRDRAKRAG